MGGQIVDKIHLIDDVNCHLVSANPGEGTGKWSNDSSDCARKSSD